MIDKHQINPSPELVEQWTEETLRAPIGIGIDPVKDLVHKAAQWGSNQELEACCEWFQEFYKGETWMLRDLKTFRSARRPEPPSLRKQALAAVEHLAKGYYGDPDNVEIVRKALEALPND